MTTAVARSIASFLRPAPDSLFQQEACRGRDARYQLLHVLWSFWVFMTPVFGHAPPGYVWSLLLSYPAFLALFFLLHVRPGIERRAYVVGLVLLAALCLKTNPSAWTYAIFASVYTPYVQYRGAILPKLAMMVAIQVPLVVEAGLYHWDLWIIVFMVIISFSSGMGSLLGSLAQAKDAELRLSHEEVRRLAATAERERIGRDLHDLLGHTLSLITLKLELSRRLFDTDHAAARRELEDAERVARKALAEVRAAVTGIRAAGLAAELASAKLMLQGSGVEFDYEQGVSDLAEDVECALALVVREAATNIHRHARARHAEVVLDQHEGDVRLVISDDGRGGVATDGNGLSGMRERVRALGGTLRIESPLGRGTRIEVRVPPRQRTRHLESDAAANDGVVPAAGAAGGRA